MTIALTLAFAQAITTPSIGTGLSSPTRQDAAAVYWNPGMTAFFEKPSVLLGGHIVIGSVGFRRVRRATYQKADSLRFNTPIPPESIDVEKTGEDEESSATPIALAPNGFGVLPLGKGFVAGFGMYAPFAGLASFDDNGAQKWALQEVKIAAINVNPSIAYRVNEQLGIGVGASYVLGYADIRKMQDFASLGELGRALGGPPINQANVFGTNAPPAVRELSVMSRPIHIRDAIAHSFTFNAGVAYQPVKRLRLGLTYQHSTPMHFNGRASLDMNDDFFTRDLASQGLQFKPLVVGDATVSFTLPKSVLLGASYEITDRIGVGTMLGYTTWSQVESFDVSVRSPDLAQPRIGLPDTASISIPRHWRDTIAADLTGRYQFMPRIGTWLTLGYRSSASPDSTVDVASPDGNRLVVNPGFIYQVSDVISLIGEAKVQTILPREVVTSDLDLANGFYRLTIVLLGGHMQITFR
jgi:long-chain fatty acid transport protein